MPSLPALDIKTSTNYSPHVVVLGAGASLAALPNGDRYGRKLPLMNNLLDVIGLKPVIVKSGLNYDSENFEKWYDELVSSSKHQGLIIELEKIIEIYFQYMRLPNVATIYDYLILSLRSKDIIATFNWDPFLGQAFARNKDILGYENMPKIVHLHGNVAIGVCYKCHTKGWRYNSCIVCDKPFSASNLLFPISKKNYIEDTFIFGEWKYLQNYVQHAYLFTIFGYSAPKTDIEAKKMMLDVWEKNETTDFGIMDLIDIKSREEIKETWKDFIIRDNYMISSHFFDSYLAIHPRRTCEAYAMATLQQAPWKENPFPKNLSLDELQNWISPLIEEEKVGILSSQDNID